MLTIHNVLKMAQHNEFGKKGEALAVEYLIENGYSIIQTNYRFQKAEVDIIAKKDDLLIGVEVKARSTNYFGNPQDFINPKKIKLLVLAMNNYIEEKAIDCEIRFDIIAILKQQEKYKIEHIENAFLYF